MGSEPTARAGVDALYGAIRAELPALDADLRTILGPGWTVTADPGGRGHPRLHLEGPERDDGRRVVVELSPVRCRAETFHATIGVSMLPGDLDLTHRDAEPGWITRVRALGEAAEAWAAADGTAGAGGQAGGPAGVVRISSRPGGGSRGPAAAKLALADRFGLPRRYAKGWPEEFLGVRTESVPGEGFPQFARDVARLASAV